LENLLKSFFKDSPSLLAQHLIDEHDTDATSSKRCSRAWPTHLLRGRPNDHAIAPLNYHFFSRSRRH
jgi:hypothetical protein